MICQANPLWTKQEEGLLELLRALSATVTISYICKSASDSLWESFCCLETLSVFPLLEVAIVHLRALFWQCQCLSFIS